MHPCGYPNFWYGLVLGSVLLSPATLRADQAASSQPQPAQTQTPADQQPIAAPAQPQPANQSAIPTPTTAAPFGEIAGTVKSGNSPLPGVTVSAANSLTGKKYVTSTDVDGSFKIAVGGRGRYVVRAEFSAFAPSTEEIVINDENRSGKADLNMVLLSRARKAAEEEEQAQSVPAMRTFASSAGRPGLQQLTLSGNGAENSAGMSSAMDPASLAGAGLPNAGLAADGGNESVAVSGGMGRAEQNLFDPGEMQDRMSDLREQLQAQGGGSGTVTINGATANIQILGGGPLGGNGVFSGGGFGGGGGGPMVFMMGGPGMVGGGGRGGRGMRGFDVNKPHGSLFYSYDGSGLDAKPYSLNGQPETKANYNQNRFGGTIGGPLNIPHIYHGGTKTFLFGNYTGTRATNPYDVFSTVPTLAERGGDFSSLLSGPNPLQLIDPVTHAPFLNNQVPVSSTASQLLSFIPQPNLPGTVRNFHFVSAAPSNTDTAFVRFNHSFGNDQTGMFGFPGMRAKAPGTADQKKPRGHWSQSVNGGFVFNGLRNTTLNPFPGLGGHQTVHNYNANFGYSAVKGLFLNSLRFTYNRSNSNTVNNFTDVNNIEGQLGISGVSQLPSDFGLPVLNFAPEFSSLQDLTPALRKNQTYTLSDSMTLSHGKHSWTWGGDFRRLLYDVSNAANARGTFLFTGAATSGNNCSFGVPCAPFADFLLGYAQQTSIQFGAQNYQFSANSWDVFFQDNWRMAKRLTFNFGLRYERVTPYTESNNQLVNLDIGPGFSSVAPVLPGQVGPVTQRTFPSGLINSSHYDFAPRLGLAWKPFSKTVVRAGYGINYNLAQYASMATQLGFQPPFAVAEINPAPTPTALTLQNGFPADTPSPNHITNTYAVDPNYQLPYVQTWNLNIQQEIKNSMVVNIGYTGAKGTHLDIVDAPDQQANGAPIFVPCTPATPATTGCVSPFLYEFSGGTSIMHAGSLRVRKRLRHGLSVGGTYTFSKSIDDASSIGGGAAVVAQEAFNVAGERGLSSFNQTHRFTADYYYELPMGTGKKWFTGDGWENRVLGGLSWSGNITMASGFPFSPRIFGSAADLGRGVTGSSRPNLVPGQSIQISNPGIGDWFNTAAFTAPKGPFGDAGRNIIIGPGTVSVNMAVSKTVQIKEMQSFELRLSANNVFNHANFSSIDTTLGSPTLGQVTAVAGMRTAQLTARYRF